MLVPRKRPQLKVNVNLGVVDPEGLERLIDFVAAKLVADILNRSTTKDSAETIDKGTESGIGVTTHV
jgi:hypothetical protein